MPITVLCKWGRRLCPSHVIACKCRYDSRALCSSPFAASRYWGIGRRRRSTGLRSLYYPGICARCTGSLPGWGCSASSSIRGCRPDRRACRTRGYKLDSCKDYHVEIFAPARTPQKPQIFGKCIFAVLLYNAKQARSYCLIAPPLILLILSYLI